MWSPVGRWTAAAVVLATLLCARFAAVGADAYWAAALGREVAGSGRIPDGVPFAAADSAGWPNVPVLGELLLAALAAPGPAGLVAGQLLLDVVALVLLGVGARRVGAADGPTAAVLGLVVLGALPAFAIVRLQVLSLALFPLLLALLRHDHRAPSRRIWWVVPLLALWGNLHGAVLAGVAVTGAYLLVGRLRQRPGETVAVGVASLAAVLANPAALGTVRYYAGVLGNEAARRGTGLWAPLDPRMPFDLLLLVVGLALVVLALWSRPPWWEVVAVVGLAGGTVTSARHGVWLLMLCAAPAARRLTRTASLPARASRLGLAVAASVLVVGSGVLVGTRTSQLDPSGSPEVVAAVAAAAQGRPVLADSPLAESLAAGGVRVWMSNPLDAFPRTDQAAYLDVLAGLRTPEAVAALEQVPVAAVRTGGPAEPLVQADPSFVLRQRVEDWAVYVRVG